MSKNTFETPSFAAPSPALSSSVSKEMAPHISVEQAARGLGNRFPYAGGAMALHQPGAGMHNSAHQFGSNGSVGHTRHNPRFVG